MQVTGNAHLTSEHTVVANMSRAGYTELRCCYVVLADHHIVTHLDQVVELGTDPDAG